MCCAIMRSVELRNLLIGNGNQKVVLCYQLSFIANGWCRIVTEDVQRTQYP